MAKITQTQKLGKEVLVQMVLSEQEFLQLRGFMDSLCVFSTKNHSYQTKVSTRGKNGVTKYLLLPRSLRKNVDMTKDIKCQQVEFDDSIAFIYHMEKNEDSKSTSQ